MKGQEYLFAILIGVSLILTFSVLEVYSVSGVTLTEPTPEAIAEFGEFVAVGDVNNDGNDDIIVGAPLATAGGFTDAGEAFVFEGPGLTTVTILTETVPEASAHFGVSVAVGDINNDGIGDVIVGAPRATAGGSIRAGEVFVFLGSTTFDSTADFTLTETTTQADARFGTSVAVGDVNNDGIGDVIVGAPLAAPGGDVSAGEVFVFLGSTTFDSTADFTLTETTTEVGASFGISVAAGDVNGDTIDDVIVGATKATAGTTSKAGEVFVFLGSTTFDSTADFTLTELTPETLGEFGFSLAAGDINGDTIDDVIVGALEASGQAGVGGVALAADLAGFPPGVPDPTVLGKAGEVFIFLGSTAFDSTADFTLRELTPEANAFFGISLAVDDVNNDGIDDVIVGAPRATAGGDVSAGEVFIFPGSATFVSTFVTILTEPVTEVGVAFGVSVAVGDVNNDGIGDVIVGAPGATAGTTSNAGEAFYFQRGDVNVGPGETGLIDDGATVDENLEVDGGDLTITEGSTITGNVEVINGGTLTIEDGSTVQGNVIVSDAGILVIEDATVDGNINTQNLVSVTITGSTINGNINSDSDGTVIIIDNPSISGNVEIINPTSCTESGNIVTGNNSGCP